MQFVPSRLRRGELLAGAGAVLLLVFMFVLHWEGHGAGALTGWQCLRGLRWLLLVDSLVALVLVVLQATRRAPALPVAFSLIVSVLGTITVLALIYRVLIDPAAGQQLGAYLCLAAALVIAGGGYLSLRTEGILPSDGPQDIPTVSLGGEGTGEGS